MKLSGHNPTPIKIEYLALKELNIADSSCLPSEDAQEEVIVTNSGANTGKICPIWNENQHFDINKIQL